MSLNLSTIYTYTYILTLTSFFMSIDSGKDDKFLPCYYLITRNDYNSSTADAYVSEWQEIQLLDIGTLGFIFTYDVHR